MIIFSEEKYAQELLDNGFKKFMSQKDLSILAKYYSSQQKTKGEIKQLLTDFCRKHNPEFNEVRFYAKIDSAVRLTNVHSLRKQMPVKVTKLELNFIKGVTDFDMQKILFCMLVLAKYVKENPTRKNPKINEKYADKFYVNSNLNDILKLARVYLKKDQKDSILHSMQTLGYIRTTLNGSFEICFVDATGQDYEVVVEDMDNAVSYLPFYCEDCGRKFQKTKRHNKCPECYKIYRNTARKY